MKLYHGSNINIEQIDLTKSKVGKDFGCGFYLSAEEHQAREIAVRKTEQLMSGVPTINVFDFDEGCLETDSLKILRFDGYTEQWAQFVLDNRQNRTRTNLHDYDIVVGPIANDTVGFQIRRYTSGIISMQQFLEELKYMKGITFQYFFGTERAINLLKKCHHE